MKAHILYILSLLLIVGFTSLKPNDERKWDWNSITDKDCLVTYVKVIADSSSQSAIDSGVRIYNTNDGARVLTKAVLSF